MRTVELLLDDAADTAVRDAWRRLAAAGLPSQAHHTGPTNAPHLTVAVCAALTPAVRARLAGAFGALPLDVRFSGPLCFSGRVEVLAWGVEPDPALTALHARVWSAVSADARPGDLNPLHAPDRWIPHVTLGRTRRARTFADGRGAALLPAPPAGARFTAARSFDTGDGSLETLHPLP